MQFSYNYWGKREAGFGANTGHGDSENGGGGNSANSRPMNSRFAFGAPPPQFQFAPQTP